LKTVSIIFNESVAILFLQKNSIILRDEGDKSAMCLNHSG